MQASRLLLTPARCPRRAVTTAAKPAYQKKAAAAKQQPSSPARTAKPGPAAKPGPQERAAAPEQQPGSGGSRSYFNVTGYPFPLGPFTSRRTIRREVDKGRIWVFEQPQVGMQGCRRRLPCGPKCCQQSLLGYGRCTRAVEQPQEGLAEEVEQGRAGLHWVREQLQGDIRSLLTRLHPLLGPPSLSPWASAT